MARKYWSDLFTGKTWEEFLKNGANVSGFRERRRKTTEQIEVGDYLICYLTGISRFVGVLEVLSPVYVDKSALWKDEVFPQRFKVRTIYELDASTALPITDFKDKLKLFKNLKSPKAWSGFFRGSPALFDPQDGKAIVDAIAKATENPVARDYDEKKYWRQAKLYQSKTVGAVTVPDESVEDVPTTAIEREGMASHEEIQWRLLKLGSDLGLDVWVARNDKGRSYEGKLFQEIPNLRKELPRQFDDATNRTIELIDILWLQGDAIVAAFEVEHTSTIYSGLLRMSDLVSMQPNIRLSLYLVAPDVRREKVFSEINRPTFARLKPSLPELCKFIPYSLLKKEIEHIGARVKYTKPEFLEAIAESCKADAE